MQHRRARVRGALASALAVVLLTGALGVAQAPAAQAAGALTFVGHGYGHGRGMGQYGALGYALDHGWSADRILRHYYGGTTLRTDAGNPEVGIEISRQTGRDLIVTGSSLTVNGSTAGAAAVRLSRSGTALAVDVAPSCGGPWTRTGTVASGAVVRPGSGLLRMCESGADHEYRGGLQANVNGGTIYTVNRLPVDQYLQGVVPRESPASWGNLGGGRGMEALKAQAVAARSYAMAPRGARASGALTCDTESCQVYLGAAEIRNDGTRTVLEAATTNAAVAATSGWVMRHSDGRIALTEFSSSTGGYTAGGTFPAVVDAGDSYAGNPNHRWTVQLSTDTVASRLGTGPIRSIRVTARNGLGDMGGRATSVEVVDTSGRSTTFTGSRVRVLLGLKSDWFTISGWTEPEARAVVTALYHDLLGRGPDATGLRTWTARLVGGTDQAELVYLLTRSDEYIRKRVRQAYVEVLGREPEAAGAQRWLEQIRANVLSVDEVQRRFYDSDEYYNRSGGTVEGYVQRLFRTALQREGTSSEIQQWSGVMRTQGRAAAVNGIWFSLEAGKIRAGAYYRVFLQREPDAPGLLTWAKVLLAQGESAVRNGIAGSQEYRQRAVVRYPG